MSEYYICDDCGHTYEIRYRHDCQEPPLARHEVKRIVDVTTKGTLRLIAAKIRGCARNVGSGSVTSDELRYLAHDIESECSGDGE